MYMVNKELLLSIPKSDMIEMLDKDVIKTIKEDIIQHHIEDATEDMVWDIIMTIPRVWLIDAQENGFNVRLVEMMNYHVYIYVNKNPVKELLEEPLIS